MRRSSQTVEGRFRFRSSLRWLLNAPTDIVDPSLVATVSRVDGVPMINQVPEYDLDMTWLPFSCDLYMDHDVHSRIIQWALSMPRAFRDGVANIFERWSHCARRFEIVRCYIATTFKRRAHDIYVSTWTCTKMQESLRYLKKVLNIFAATRKISSLLRSPEISENDVFDGPGGVVFGGQKCVKKR